MNIDLYLKEFTQLWNNSASIFPTPGLVISVDEKIKRETTLVKLSKNKSKITDIRKLNGIEKERFSKKMNVLMADFFKTNLNFTNDEVAIITEMNFSKATKRFMTMARNFDPDVSIEDVYQASRNLWIVNSLQIMMGKPLEVTGSIFAYSMLYPYSDNYLDDPEISVSRKLAFSKRFRKRLQGENVIPMDQREKVIFDLVAMIEEDWDRKVFSELFESLIAIHDAQTKSIFLLNDSGQLSCDDLLSICIEKGGTSVLADGYLIEGTLSTEMERFCFGFGTFLQFVDDIQDINEDMDDHVRTLFTYAAERHQLDEYTNKTIAFSTSVMADLSCFSIENLDHMRGLMTKSVNFLLTEAVGLNEQWFSKSYVENVECYSPFRFSFVRKRKSKLESNRISLIKRMEVFVDNELEMAMQA
jgi:hypothetical protein